MTNLDCLVSSEWRLSLGAYKCLRLLFPISQSSTGSINAPHPNIKGATGGSTRSRLANTTWNHVLVQRNNLPLSSQLHRSESPYPMSVSPWSFISFWSFHSTGCSVLPFVEAANGLKDKFSNTDCWYWPMINWGLKIWGEKCQVSSNPINYN